MEQGRGEAAVAEGDLERTGAETVADAVQALVGGAGGGGAASPRAGSVAAAADLEEKKVAVADSAVADSAVPVLGVTAVVVLSLTVEWGVGMERQGPSYGEVVSTKDVRVHALLGRSNSPTSRSPEAVEWIMNV